MLPFWLIPAICAVLAAVFTLMGTVTMLRSLRRVRAHAEHLQATAPALFDSVRLEMSTQRISDDLEGMQPLLARSVSALHEIGAGLRELRLRDATIALRVALVAMRALAALR